MGKCKAGHYKTNEVVTHGAIVCHGFRGQPPCNYLIKCAEENGMKLSKNIPCKPNPLAENKVWGR